MWLPSGVRAGAMLWQISGMEGSENCYAMANKRPWVLSEAETARDVGVWTGARGTFATAADVMRWEIWHILKTMNGGKNRPPTYRELIGSGVISVNLIQMPELLDNAKR